MAGQWGRKRETWGTVAVVDDFYPVLSSNATINNNLMHPKGIRAGRHMMVPGVLGGLDVKGSVSMEVLAGQQANIFKDILGAPTGSGPLTYPPGTPLAFTAQQGVTDSTGTVRPATLEGCKVDSAKLSAKVGEFVILSMDYTARDIYLHRTVTDGATNSNTSITSATAAFTAADVGRPISGGTIPAGATIASVQSGTAATLSAAASGTGTGITFVIGTALASASYGSSSPLTFVQASVTAAGSAIASANSFEWSLTKNLRNNRHVLGSTRILEQLEEDYWTSETTVEADFDSNAFNILMLSGGQASLVFTMSDTPTGGTSTTTLTQNVQVVGDLPSLSKMGLESQSLKFTAGHASSDASACQVVVSNGETSAV